MQSTLRLKTLTLITLSLFVPLHFLSAQNIAPTMGTIEHEDKERPCWVAQLDPEPKTLKEAWKDYINDNYDVKLKGLGLFQNKDLLSAEEVNMPELSTKKINFYTHVVEDENGSEMKVFASYGYDIYMGKEKYNTEFSIIKNIFANFIQEYLPKYYNEQIDDTKDRMEELADEIDDLKGDIEDDKEDIADLQDDIKELHQRIEDHQKVLSATEIKLSKRQEKLQRIESEFKKW